MAVLAQVVLHLAFLIVDRLHPAGQPLSDSRLIHDVTAPFDRSRQHSDLLHTMPLEGPIRWVSGRKLGSRAFGVI